MSFNNQANSSSTQPSESSLGSVESSSFAKNDLASTKSTPNDTPSAKRHKPITPMITRDQYIDYDFSTIRDTKGGFLYDPKLDPQAPGSQFKDRAPIFIKDLPTATDAKDIPRCKVCDGLAIDPVFRQIFRLNVCDKCKQENPDRFSLLTKTEVKEDYMLTEDELRDKELFLSWSKPNPRKSTWNNMILYVREQVEEYAYKKWGGSEGLDAEFERRESAKKKKKDVKFKAKLRGNIFLIVLFISRSAKDDPH
ncbi:DNA repair protein rad14, variant 2 [Entomophthora muscae]|uniref:DNA repair protein rad14, variant 2 n=1 Tax=Entomophthora muscae TaxID=34485 RepID=A0ACC2TPY3_9FUNG|nr:DNA repair protein rad14, variant 2 [Entomophthora muscae]